jgi:hypothetical protein
MKLSPKEHNLDDVFRERLKDLQTQPSELPWFAIEASLPARSVFGNPIRVIAGAAATVVTAVFAVVAFLPGTGGLEVLAGYEVSSKSLQQRLPAHTSAQAGEAPVVTVTFYGSETPALSAITPSIQPAPTSLEPVAMKDLGPHLVSLGTEALPTAETQRPLHDPADRVGHGQSLRGLRIGAVGAANNTWLFSAPEAPVSTEIVGFKPTVGTAVGFSLGYDFTDRAGVQVDVMLSSSEGQRFSVMTEEGLVTSSAKANYLRIPVLYKKRFVRQSDILNTPVALSYVAGLQYGRLNWVSSEPQNDMLDLTDFNTQELGVVMGLEYDVHFAKNYVVSLGARAAVNNDINAFPFFMSDEYAESASFSFGAQLKLSYLLRTGS